MNNFKVLMNGIVKENPTFVLLLGMCPTLGTTSSAINGMGMGLATMFVLICSNVGDFRYQEPYSGYGAYSFFHCCNRIVRNTAANGDAGLRSRTLCDTGLVYSADCGKLYRTGPRRGFCCQK